MKTITFALALSVVVTLAASCKSDTFEECMDNCREHALPGEQSGCFPMCLEQKYGDKDEAD